jgi:hypothetical protein
MYTEKYYIEETILPITSLKFQVLFMLVSVVVHAPPHESLVVMVMVQQKVYHVL